MTGMTEAMPRSPEAWKSMGCCVDFPQPWADLMWGLEFEDTHPLARVFRQAGASVCEHDCPVSVFSQVGVSCFVTNFFRFSA